jgi:antirestriction protein ArdC
MLPATEPNNVEIDKTCEAVVQGWDGRPELQLTSTTERRAYYRPATDSVHMPARFRFVDASLYYSTIFHELVHSTRHESRLSRSFGASFGEDVYSKEELVAQTGAAFLCALVGVANDHTESNTTACIQNWIQQLEDDNRLILQAGAAAQRAVDMITGQNPAEPEEQPGGAGSPLSLTIGLTPSL